MQMIEDIRRLLDKYKVPQTRGDNSVPTGEVVADLYALLSEARARNKRA